MEKQISLPNGTKEIIKSYFELPLGGKKVKCPYFMNLKGERAGLRVMIGKGTVEEIVHEVMVWAQLKGVGLNKMSTEEIRSFMIKKGIGIDCSGFAVYVLDAWFKEIYHAHLWESLHYKDNSFFAKLRRRLRPVENIGAELLTSEINCTKVTHLQEILPGDLIRAKGKQNNAHHVAVITDVFYNDKGIIEKFVYTHSHRFYELENGVREGYVIITDPEKELKDQEWHDHYQNRNYMLEDLLVDYQDNGIRRLKASVPFSAS
ncbi:MAG: hypothetical protein US52_C0001G0008 [candidate division WS6 bacterium GW2011_GWA2_37_6]|uniref:Uncharacterized protein n=1 Tax=candidate division WS6 bacterium GW2011_GWA2_37_6 TaxID=1619087 RepID=A0A0G0HCS2_9BACT|nr:MAG: hypothetical protein US52_C0001G0008 [candidate division WS6 bacterium GW2011_GWA2_37_6]